MKTAVLINLDSGKAEELGSNPKEKIVSVFRQEGIPEESLDLLAVPCTELKEAAEQLLNFSPDMIVAGGGDGTVNLLVNMIHHTDTVLGILPLGTFNHFARDAGIPLEMDAALRTLIKGDVQSVDIAEVNGHIFVNNSSVGIYPLSVTERKYQQRRLNIGKIPAMTLAVLKTIFWFPRYSITAKSQEIVHSVTSPAFFIGNNRYHLSPFSIGKRESVTEGILCGYAFECTRFFCPVHFLFLLLFNQLKLSDKFIDLRFREIILNSSKKHLKVSLDGEILKLNTPLIYKNYPGKLRLMRKAEED